MKKSLLIPLLLTFGGCMQNPDTAMEHSFEQIFPQGEKLPEQFSQYFIGQAWLARLTADPALNCPVSNVTFEPGCRNNWHSHSGGQLLIVTAGLRANCIRATWWRFRPTPSTGTEPHPTAGSPIWPSKPIRKATATSGSARWTTNNTPKQRPANKESGRC